MQNNEKDYGFQPHLLNLSVNAGAELMRYAREREDVLSLAQGEGDAPTPDFIREAAKKALDEGHTFYAPPLGIDALRTELSDYYKRIYNVDVSPNRIFVTASGSKAMSFSLQSLLNKGDDVLAVTPIWKNLLNALEVVQSRILEVPMDEDAGVWSLDIQKIFDAFTPQTKVILITSPSNPTGWVMEKDDMRAVLDFAREKDVWIISDEVYGRTMYGRDHAPSFLEVAEPDDKLYTINTLSKSWAMTGWRLGWIVGPPKAEPLIRDIALYDYMMPVSFVQHAGLVAIRDGEDFLQQQRDEWKENLQILSDGLSQRNHIVFSKPPATFYSFIRVEGETDCIALGRKLIEKAGLSIAPGCSFGKAGRGYMRFCFAGSNAKIEEAVRRLLTVI